MTPERKQRILDVIDQRQMDLTVITDAIVKDRNLAAIVRTCDAVGIGTMHCVAMQASYRTYSGTSASANNYVEMVLHDTTRAAIRTLQSERFQVLAAHRSVQASDYRQMDYTCPTAILMGTELTGVSEEALSICDHHIFVPMMGMVESYNVSVACAIILAEAQKQRQELGMYSNSNTDDVVKARLFLKWAYPKLAAYCDEHGLPYPPLDDSGNLIPGTAPSACNK